MASWCLGGITDALAAAHDATVSMIDTSIVREHQHGACITMSQRQSMGGGHAGGSMSEIRALVDGNGLPVRPALSPGEAYDIRRAGAAGGTAISFSGFRVEMGLVVVELNVA